ncbi:MAG: hypoxanthine phosphoribosyltransferase [Candidatus Sumerlaeota bacterium]
MPAVKKPEILFDEKALHKRVREMAHDISRDYSGKDLVLVGVLKGAVVFMSDLTRAITIPHEWDLIRASSYGKAKKSPGKVQISKETLLDVKNRDVLLIDDIYDSGRTMRVILDHIRQHNPASVRTCVLAVKNVPHVEDIPIDYYGFEVPDRFVVGYGLDHAERYRDLPFLGAVD